MPSPPEPSGSVAVRRFRRIQFGLWALRLAALAAFLFLLAKLAGAI